MIKSSNLDNDYVSFCISTHVHVCSVIAGWYLKCEIRAPLCESVQFY